MKSFKNVIYSDTPPSIHDLWLKGTNNPKDPFEIRIFKGNRWVVIDQSGESIEIENNIGQSTNSTMSQKAITDELNKLRGKIETLNKDTASLIYDNIEYRGNDVQYDVNVSVEYSGNASNAYICSGRDKCTILSSNKDTLIKVSLNTTYTYKYEVNGDTIEKDIKFEPVYPIFYICTDSSVVDNINSEKDIPDNAIKIVENNIDDTIDIDVSEDYNVLAILIPKEYSIQVNSGGFIFPLTKQEEDVKYYDILYSKYKSGPLKKGLIKSLTIKINN